MRPRRRSRRAGRRGGSSCFLASRHSPRRRRPSTALPAPSTTAPRASRRRPPPSARPSNSCRQTSSFPPWCPIQYRSICRKSRAEMDDGCTLGSVIARPGTPSRSRDGDPVSGRPSNRRASCRELLGIRWILGGPHARAKTNRRLLLCLDPAHAAHDPPLVRRHRLDREPRLLGQHHVLEPPVGFDGLERHRLGQRPHRLHVDRAKHRGIVGRVRIGFPDHLDDADDLLLVAGVIEKRVVAEPHRLEVLPGAVVPHAGPRLALAAALDLVVPGKRLRLGLQQPIRHGNLPVIVRWSPHTPGTSPACGGGRHREAMPGGGGLYLPPPQPSPASGGGSAPSHPSARNGRVSSDSIAASMSSRPSSTAATAAATGMSIPRAFAISLSTEAVKIPSTSLPRCASSSERPSPSAIPSEKFRDCRLEQVRIRSPRPERPVRVSGLAPKALPKRTSSAKPRVVRAAAALAPSRRPSTMPAAIASTFLAAPPISTPRKSVE